MNDLIPIAGLNSSPAPFTSGNFKLTVLSRLVETRQLNFGAFVEFLSVIEGPNFDYEKDGYAPSTKARRYLKNYPIKPELLANIKTLWFDGGLEIYPYIYPFWGGETEEFDIPSLIDIARLPNLTTFGFSSMLTTTDLDPLRNHPSLENLELGLTGTWRNIDALLTLPKLQYLQVFASDVSSFEATAVVTALHKRGVAIDMF